MIIRNETLIAAHKQTGKTQAQVAKKIGFAEVAYQRYKYNQREPKVTTAIKMTNTLGVKNFNEFCKLWNANPKIVM